ncbi:hypothetical protein C8A01DRAFT_49833 [Parachaetomium inaequale]|uniref:SRR1-like domain-containing protein n=1 Tax=Parachaetomium inaequale TaxID=2588326 RepID=A0AAN6P8C4_9PEZI|nr:hypothetical protein C8A01DRAFT_49833 [Parachaetomium inaequale]
MSTARSVAQHVLVLAVRKWVAAAARGVVKCYAQDPSYTAVDKRLLRNKGVTVLEDPRGFLEVDDDSVVISISPTVPVRQIVADIARPMVLIWDRGVEVEEEAVLCTDPVSKRVEEMMKDYIELPWSPKAGSFDMLAVYVRKDTYQGEA